MERLPSLRASDADREQASERLRHATAEGRLSDQELEERLDALFNARTYGEIDALLADLPVTHASSWPPARIVRWAAAAGAATLAVAVLGMLALMHGRSAAAAGGPGPSGHFRFSASFAGPHQLAIVVASMVGLLAVLSACAALVWVLMRSRTSSGV